MGAPVTPITSVEPACYGVMCDRHLRCARYAAVENMPPCVIVISHCQPGYTHEHPLFVPIEEPAQ